MLSCDYYALNPWLIWRRWCRVFCEPYVSACHSLWGVSFSLRCEYWQISVLLLFELLETQNWFLFWSLFFGANLCKLAWGKIKINPAVTGNTASEDFLLSIPVVPAIEFLSLIYQVLWKKDPEDRVGGIQSSKLVLLTSWDSFNLGREEVWFGMDGVQN